MLGVILRSCFERLLSYSKFWSVDTVLIPKNSMMYKVANDSGSNIISDTQILQIGQVRSLLNFARVSPENKAAERM